METHISWVFLTGPFAYKLKKPLGFGFLDHTTLEKRRRFCGEEVRVSGRFAPEIYLAAVPITGSPDAPRMGSDGPAIEWAVKLVQFAEAEVYGEAMNRRVYERLDGLAGALLVAGRRTVVDAACLRRWQRDVLATAGGSPPRRVRVTTEDLADAGFAARLAAASAD